jgi:hypothetical protein
MKRLALILALLPAPAMAASWSPPEGCEIFMTVQAKGCRVSNHYTCTADPAGDQWRADFDQEGIYFYSRINREAEWIESFDVNPTVRQSLDPGAEDPASFSELLATGMDTYVFSLTREDGTHSNVTGFDRLTGRSFNIDGVALEETEFDYTETDDSGFVLRRARGNEYISRDRRLFFAGPGETDLGDGQWLPIDGSPVNFAFPGDKGFASTQPIYDCDALTARAEPAVTPETIVRAALSAPLPASPKE